MSIVLVKICYNQLRNEVINTKIGQAIRATREDKDMTQAEVAELIPMNRSNYSKIERETQEPSIYQLRRICQILNISADRLLGLGKYEEVTEQDINLLKDIKNIIQKYKETKK